MMKNRPKQTSNLEGAAISIMDKKVLWDIGLSGKSNKFPILQHHTRMTPLLPGPSFTNKIYFNPSMDK